VGVVVAAAVDVVEAAAAAEDKNCE